MAGARSKALRRRRCGLARSSGACASSSRGAKATARSRMLRRLIEEASALGAGRRQGDGYSRLFRIWFRQYNLFLPTRSKSNRCFSISSAMLSRPCRRTERRELAISTRLQDLETVQIAIADTGPGIAPEIASQLFQPFVTSKRTGMGVGLSISRTIIEAHGGRLWAEANPGGGTVFRLTLQAVDEKEIDNV